ncbi:phytanoyl-CoA dioxygenase family protein [Verticiella alkaliphila]|uniref:phytanoyl-CoA dioxygenase family protein n=1 Tax=Verticiella alkaliphila TaxID=2779529 RepID=UPI00209AB505|nr:phytanoyl-CoA dioxygenase family protein [Verticiella sp. GG226]
MVRQANDARDQAVLAYHQDGYTAWPASLSQDLLHRLGSATHAIQSQVAALPQEMQALLAFERDLSTTGRGGIDAKDVGDAIFIIGDPSRFDPVFLELVQTPIIRQAASALLGCEDLALHFINVTIKHPRFGRGIGWHRDYPNPSYCTEHADFLRLMLCLDGMDETSGATRFIPGSHMLSDAQAVEEKTQRNWPKPSPSTGCALTCGTGHIVAIHPKVLHGGPMNTSSRPRRNIVIQIGKASAPMTGTERDSVSGLRLRRPLP